MSRPASQALGGYFKTQDDIRPLIYRRFAEQRVVADYCVCDPCAGEGEAVIGLVNHVFGPLKDRRRPSYGVAQTMPEVSLITVELEEERARRADSAGWGCVDERQFLRGDGLCCDASGKGCSLLWLNPPYDFFRGQRFEARFLDAWAPRIAGGGQLVLIVPEHALPYLAATLTTWFDGIEVLRYPEPTYSDFKQVVVLGTKRTLRGEAGPLPAATCLRDSYHDADFRPRVVPPGELKVDVNALNVSALRAATSPWCGQAGYDRAAVPPQIGLAMRPKPAHVAMALGSGVFNGVRLSAPGLPDILAKAVFHRQFVDADSKKDEHGEVIKLTQVERPQLRLTTLDLTTGEYRELSPATEPSGKMENFADLLLAYGDSMVAAMRERCPSLHDGQEDVPLRPMARTLFPAQASAVRAALKLVARGETPLILGEIGSGKCLKIGTKVLLYSGEQLAVEDVRPGHLLMGPDSKPRKVLGTTRGTGPLFEISPVQGAPWVCNDAHILTLVHTMSGDVFDVPVLEYTSQKRLKLHLTKGNRTTHPVMEFKQFFPETGVDFEPAAPLPLDPYFFGVWCGDGTKNLNSVAVTKPDLEIKALMEETASAWGLQLRCNINNDRCPTWTITGGQTGGRKNALLSLLRELVVNDELPASYLTAARKDRQAFLAGFLDTDGYLHNNCFEIAQKRKSWADAICFVATSLGIRATRTVKYVNQVPYHRVQLSGDFTQLPLRLPRKQAGQRAVTSSQYGGSRSMKKVNRTGIKVRPVGAGEYAGFELDGDGRFLLGDFTVTHNTSVALQTLWALNDPTAATIKAIRGLPVEHAGAFPTLAHVPTVRRVLVVCPPHLVKNWQDEAAACLPDVPVVTLDRVSDVDAVARMTQPLVICVLSREQAKLGHGVEGIGGKHCPRCGKAMAGDAEKRGKSRAVCDKHVSEPLDVFARIAWDMRRRGAWAYGQRAAIAPLLRMLRAGTTRKKETWGGYSHKMDHGTQEKIVAMLKLCAPDPRVLRCLRRIYPETVKYGQSTPTEQPILASFAHKEDSAALRAALADMGKWKTTPCGEPLYQAIPQPRRFPLADYICRKQPRLFELMVPDECFVAGTLVSDRPIETLTVGDYVLSYTEDGALKYKKIVRVYKKRATRLCRVTMDSVVLNCTLQHPFLTQRGWVAAGELDAGIDIVLRSAHENTNLVHRPLQSLSKTLHRRGSACIYHSTTRLWVLLLRMRAVGKKRRHWPCQQKHVTREPSDALRANDSGQSIQITGYGCQDQRGTQRQAFRSTWRQRQAHGAAASSIAGFGFADRNGCLDGGSSTNLREDTEMLQGGHRPLGNQTRNRGRWQRPPNNHWAATRPKENGGLVRTRVDRVEILEQTSDGTFGGVCPDGFVYNIEVESTHNYFANGILVHNCHEYGTDGSAQERAIHRLCEKIPLKLPLTGSLMNGYAKSLFRNMWSFSKRMRAEFAYDEHGKFCKLYGYQKRVLTGDALKKAVVTEFGGSSDRVVKTEGGERLSDAPGVLPSFVLRHVLPLSVTLHKRDITPDDRVVDHDRAEIPITDAAHAGNGSMLGHKLKDAVTKDRYDEERAGKLFGQLAEYPSYFDRATHDTGNAGPLGMRCYEIRYPEDVGGDLVASAEGLPNAQWLAKEAWLLALLRKELGEGRNVLIFLWHKELSDRLIRLCREAGETPAFLDANKVQAKKRQDWIDKNVVGKRRVMITNPSCVQTGLNNLIWFSTAVFFENPGCNPFVARQAVGRLDRITQTKEVHVYWPVYEGVQCALLDLLQAKTAISQQIDGIDPTAALEMAGAGDGAQVQTHDVGLAVYKYLGGE